MSIFLDQKYLMLVSNQLPRFTRKNDNTFNCRCIICGDSAKKASKARGYFYPYKNDLMYKCYNCDASMYLSTFLKRYFLNVYQEYAVERYSEGHGKYANVEPILKMAAPVFKTSEERLLDKLLDRLDTLPENNEAVQFCIKRKIPKNKFNQLYFIPNVKNIVQLNDKYKASILGEEPRLVLPFYNEHSQLTGVTCRALRGETLRYITVKLKDDEPLLFGLQEVDKSKPVYVVEGPIDSLFLDNCIAAAGTSLNKVNNKDYILIFDNQPRNIEVCKIILKNIDAGFKVVIWPQKITAKDVNEMVLEGIDVLKLVKDNVYHGLTAKAKFIAWKRC